MQNVLNTLSTIEEQQQQDYKAVKGEQENESDEELKQQSGSPQLVIADDEQPEQKQPKSIQQQQQQQQQQPKLNINQDYLEIDVRMNKNWSDRIKQVVEPKYTKRMQVPIKEPILFTMDKPETKHGRSFLSYIFGSDYRYLYIVDGFLYVLQLKNDIMHVKSVHCLTRLFKIIIEQNQLTFCLINASEDKKSPPKVKAYQMLKGIDQKGKILMRLRSELNKLGYEFHNLK